MSTLKWSFLIGLLAVTGMAGCGGGSDNPATADVTGTVMYNGAPVANASITFSPVEKGGNAAGGATDAQGKYTLTTFEAGDGAVPGSYKVMVSKSSASAQIDAEGTEEEPDAAILAAEAAGIDVTGSGEGGDAGAGAAVAVDLLPPKYKKKETTDLTAEVSSGSNTIDFELAD